MAANTRAAPRMVSGPSGSLRTIAPSRTANTDSDSRTVAEVVSERDRRPMAHSMVGTEVHSRPTYRSAGREMARASPGPPRQQHEEQQDRPAQQVEGHDPFVVVHVPGGDLGQRIAHRDGEGRS